MPNAPDLPHLRPDLPRDSDTGPPETRQCSRCREELPLAAFRLRRKGTGERHTLCRLCANAYARDHHRQLRHKAVQRFTVEACDAHVHKQARDVAALVSEMLRRFGGPAAFAKIWHEAIDEARDRKRYAQAARGLNTLVRFMMAGEELQKAEAEERQRSFGRLSHAEMEQARDAALARLIQAEPELAIRAAASIGWEIRPPESEEWVRL